jgi:hypothetical protein
MNDEQIEAVRRAILSFKCTCEQRSIVCSRCEARAAIAAYRPAVEGMVREAAKLSLYEAMSNTPWGDEPQATDKWCADIVARVMGAG